MQKFSDVLLTLDDASHVQRIALFHSDGSPAGVIENKPGSQGSVKVYYHLYRMYGEISLDAAVSSPAWVSWYDALEPGSFAWPTGFESFMAAPAGCRPWASGVPGRWRPTGGPRG
jgi:hypothetical protein